MTDIELRSSPLAKDSIVVLIRIHTPETSDPSAIYEKVRKWWRMSRVQAERAARVLAVVEGVVAEVYTPARWLDAPADKAGGRIGFVGDVAADRNRWVGASVMHLFKAGAANPVRYLPASAFDHGSIDAPDIDDGGLALLLRLNQSWHEAISADDLYEVARGWWVLSATNAERVVRVLAVAAGLVREVYEPTDWQPSPILGLENRIGFNGVVAQDRATYVGRDVSHLFRPGSANPVRYLPLALLGDETLDAVAPTPVDSMVSVNEELVEPGLLERVLPLLTAFEQDLLWAQSRAGQELFHSNTIAWLLKTHPQACISVLELLGGVNYPALDRIDVWRERHNLDIAIDPVEAYPKVVVENKLYSIPYPAQLTKYNVYPVPWSPSHGTEGSMGTRYVLLSLMAPSFPLPAPWVHVAYSDLANALDLIDERDFGQTTDLFVRYRALVHRLVALAEAADPAQALDEQFSVAEVVAQMPGGGLDGAIAKMRFSGLAQAVQAHFTDPKELELDGARGGSMTYWRRLTDYRGRVGWQFQENQLRLQITVEDPDLQGKGNEVARATIVEAEHVEFFDHREVEAILGSELRSKTYTAGQWNHFNPDFVYRHRPVRPTISTALLAAALAQLTKQVDEYADSSRSTPAPSSPT